MILGIETSCDDTGCALVDGGGRVLASAVSRQLAVHRPFGGVVPELASREHLSNWPTVSASAFAEAGLSLDDVEVVAATRGPGLVGSLLVGLSLGKALAYGLGRPFYAVHHLEGHLYSPFLTTTGEAAAPIPERFLGLVVSGGHTSLFEVEGSSLETIAETRDDAMGEVFDKVGKRLALPYPQGPLVDRLAEHGDAERFSLPLATMSDGSLDFSYSGLKSEALRVIERLEREGVASDLSALEDAEQDEAPRPILDLLASFRAAAVAQLVDRLDRYLEEKRPEMVAVSGGVAANRLLRRELAAWGDAKGIELRLVPLAYAGDNAAMIAHAALIRQRHGDSGDPLSGDEVEAASRIPI
ncbi:MAG TPA: tRNA (adenosine(37)-N6)-threonylcarbamoyltransferase complex transferase subunit TsaD [Thermoanaerobaculia bacterium]|nr:tRNA (adenosine(37)-N6)-threonylcarbamoyltransferase complex transferase subunit TsaD [Thermoanaerobaculia bacterium]